METFTVGLPVRIRDFQGVVHPVCARCLPMMEVNPSPGSPSCRCPKESHAPCLPKTVREPAAAGYGSGCQHPQRSGAGSVQGASAAKEGSALTLAGLGGCFLPSSRVGAVLPIPHPWMGIADMVAGLACSCAPTWFARDAVHWKGVVAEMSVSGNLWREINVLVFRIAALRWCLRPEAVLQMSHPADSQPSRAEHVSCPAARQTSSFPGSSGGMACTMRCPQKCRLRSSSEMGSR